jgi:tetratricopeptide (TPR) repeat protein
MAYYFTGNVYNDWGSQTEADALEQRAKGNLDEANRLREKANELWDKAEQAYTATKSLAPNYVQTHHQVGLLFMKRAEAAQAWGDLSKSQTYYDEALRNFELYRMLDPVFPPNYDRIAQILVLKGKTDEAIDLYKQAIYYNDAVAKSINKVGYPDRVSQLALSVAKLLFNEAVHNHANPYNPPSKEILESIQYFKMAADAMPTTAEAWKGLAFLYQKTGQMNLAQDALRKARQINPNDPAIQNAPQPAG